MTKLEGDFESRKQEFVKRYYALVEETGVDFASVPVYQPNDKRVFELFVQNIPTDMRAGTEEKAEGFTSPNAPTQA